MNCSRAEKMLASRALGLLSLAQARKLARHEENCATCRERAAGLEKAEQALAAPCGLRLPANLADRVLRNLPASAPPAPRRWLLWSPVLAGAVILLVVFAGPFIRQRPPDMTTQEVLDAYSEDIKSLGLWESQTSTNGNSVWNYQDVGVPQEISQYLL